MLSYYCQIRKIFLKFLENKRGGKMVKYGNEIINPKNILYIKAYVNAINIYFIGGTNHWMRFENEETKNAILTSLQFNMN